MKCYNCYYDKYVPISHYAERRIVESADWIISATCRNERRQ